LTPSPPETWKQAFIAARPGRTVVLVGVPTPEMTLEIPLLDVFGRAVAEVGWYGDGLPPGDFHHADRAVPAGSLDWMPL